ncbi:MAG TPA: amino acid permease [Armatimonadetes bacterium]|nr:amino acid permease [Armatimonadota bacterium]
MFDAVCVIIGIVIGAGIFKAPALVAQNTSNGLVMLFAWLLGGLFCVCGALCYAELASAYPHAGGDYVYLTRAFGRFTGFAFVWARMAVIQTGSIASLAYIFGDYATQILPLGVASPTIYAALSVLVFTFLNVIGVHESRWTQNLLTSAKVIALLAIVAIGLMVASEAPRGGVDDIKVSGGFGLAMVFVLYTYGGWNEAAYVAGELRDVHRNMSRAILASILTLIAIYLLINIAFLRVLGFHGMRASDVVAADAMSRVFGRIGAIGISALVAFSALSATNGSIFTGARAIYAMGSDYATLHWLGRWHRRFKTPSSALIVQGVITVILILLAGIGEGFRKGFETMVEYTAPVFWFFLLLTSISLFALRIKDKSIERPFKAPLHPFTALAFCGMCVYMLYCSLAYVRIGALAGIAVLLLAIPLYAFMRIREGMQRHRR